MISARMQKLYPRSSHLPSETIDITGRIHKDSLSAISQRLEVGRFAFFADDISIKATNHDGFFDFLSRADGADGICITISYNDIELFRGDAFRYEPVYDDSKPKIVKIILRNNLARTNRAKLANDITIKGGMHSLHEIMQALLEQLNSKYQPGLSGIFFDDDIALSPFEMNMKIEQQIEDFIYDYRSGQYYAIYCRYDGDVEPYGRILYSIWEINSQTSADYIRNIFVMPESPTEPVPSWRSPNAKFIRANLCAGHMAIFHLGRVIIAELDGSFRSVEYPDFPDDAHNRILIRSDGSYSLFDDPVHADGRYYYLEKASDSGRKTLEKYAPSSDRLLGSIDLPVSEDDSIFLLGEEKVGYYLSGNLHVVDFDGIEELEAEVPELESSGNPIPVYQGRGDIVYYYLGFREQFWFTTDSAYFMINNIRYPAGTSLFDMLSDLAQLVDGCIYARFGEIFLMPRSGFIREHRISSDYISEELYERSFVNIAFEMPSISLSAIGMSDDSENPFGEHTVMGAIRRYYRQHYSSPRRRRVFMLPFQKAIEINIGDRLIISDEEGEQTGLVIERELYTGDDGALSRIIIEGDIE
ncbi:MAG: hypothetical protein ACLFSQ_11065 [Candidatus Zixiibacteriota bacterium]